jgi:mannose-6-phosphate isomerase-like protein (cupin superfamily)
MSGEAPARRRMSDEPRGRTAELFHHVAPRHAAYRFDVRADAVHLLHRPLAQPRFCQPDIVGSGSQLRRAQWRPIRNKSELGYRHYIVHSREMFANGWRDPGAEWNRGMSRPLRRKGRRPMKGYCDNIQQRTVENADFRRVLYTGHHMQLVLMTLQPGEEIGEEVHDDRDQFFRIEEGSGEIRIDGVANAVEDDFAVIVPAGARHNVINTGQGPLRLYTLYGPPEHRDGVVHRDKAQAEAAHEADHWDGRTTE